MKIKDLYGIVKYSEMELHSAFDGKMVASTAKSVKKFEETEVLSIMPLIKARKDSCYARAYLYVFVDENDVKRIKEEEK